MKLQGANLRNYIQLALSDEPDGMTPTNIADDIGVSVSTVTGAIKKLADRGTIRVEGAPGNWVLPALDLEPWSGHIAVARGLVSMVSPFTMSDLARASGVSKDTAINALRKLAEDGTVIRAGAGPMAQWFKMSDIITGRATDPRKEHQ